MVKCRAMSTETMWAIGGIVATAVVGVWAINDARKQVKEQTAIQRNLAWTRIVNDFMWDFVDPTDKAHSPEVTKGLSDFVLLSKALDPRKNPDTLKRTAEYEAARMAQKAVADGSATWKSNLNVQGVQEVLREYEEQKDIAREQRRNRKFWSRV